MYPVNTYTCTIYRQNWLFLRPLWERFFSLLTSCIEAMEYIAFFVCVGRTERELRERLGRRPGSLDRLLRAQSLWVCRVVCRLHRARRLQVPVAGAPQATQHRYGHMDRSRHGLVVYYSKFLTQSCPVVTSGWMQKDQLRSTCTTKESTLR